MDKRLKNAISIDRSFIVPSLIRTYIQSSEGIIFQSIARNFLLPRKNIVRVISNHKLHPSSCVRPHEHLDGPLRKFNPSISYLQISIRRFGFYFLAKEIFMALEGVILKPCKASLAAPACISFSNSTKAMSCRPGTRRTSLNPGNLKRERRQPLY